MTRLAAIALLAVAILAVRRHRRPAPLDRDAWPEGVGWW